MTPIYEQMQQEEKKEVSDAVHKFVEAVWTFQKLNPEQKQCFFQNAVLQKFLSEVINDDQYECFRVY